MLRHRHHEESEQPDEERIRADERAAYERELRSLEEDRRAHEADRPAPPAMSDRPADDPFEHPPEGGPVIDRDRDGVDDRDERTTTSVDRDRDGVDDRDERTTTYVDRDRDGVDDRDERIGDRDRDDERIEVVRERKFSFGQLLTLIAGGLLLALGIVALVSTGVDTGLGEPGESVLGWNHTTWLAVAEIVAGALLVLFALRPGGRWFVALIGAALVVGGVLILAENDWTTTELGAEQEYGWVPIAVGAAALVASLLTPRRYQKVTGVPADRW